MKKQIFTLFLGLLPVIGLYSQTTVEAEAFASQSGCTLISGTPTIMDFGGPGSYLEWVVNVSTAGTASFNFIYANGDTGGSRFCDLIVNGTNTGSIEFTSNNDWLVYQTASKNGVLLNSGNNTLRLSQTSGGGPNLDRFDYTVSTGGGSTNRLEAESGTFSGGVLTSHPSASGGQFVDGNAGFNISWTYNASAAGNHVLDFSVASPSGSRSMGVFVNNSKVGTITTSAARYSWEIQSVTASLNSGNNTIELRDTENTNEPDVDYVEVILSPGGGGDNLAPSVPTGLVSSNITSTSAIIAWNASTDNVGVTGYNVFVDGVSVGTANDNDRTITGLSPSTTYAITVSAFDAAGNTSALSNPLSVTTAGSGGGGNVSNIYVEAESGTVESPMQVLSDGNASGGQYVAVTSGSSTAAPPANGKTSITVDLEAGTYKIWGRVQASDGGSDSYWVRVNGGTAYQWNNIPQSTNYRWDDVHDADNNNIAVTWTLSAGSHTVEFLYREPNTRLDRIYITKNGDAPNDSGTPGPDPVYNRVRKLGTNMSFFFYGTEGCSQTLSNPWIFKANGLNLATETNPWEPLFLDDHKIFSVIRFMNWNGGNGDPKVNWSQRTLKGDPKQEGRNMAGGINDQDFSTQPDGRQTNGVAFEWEVDLCNRLNADMWINVPAKTMDPADFPNGDDYNNEFVYKMAILMKHGVDMKNVNIKSLVGGKNNLDQLKTFDRQWFVDRGGEITGDPLNTNLKVYVEYANEVWCCGDGNYRPSAVWARSKSDDIGFESNAHWLFAPWAEIRSWKAYEDVFGANRIVKVAGSASAWLTRIDDAFNRVYNNVSNNRNKWNIRPDKWKWANYTRAGGTPADAANFRSEWTAGLIERAEGPRVNNLSWRELRDHMRDVYGLALIGYEGGQSMADNNSLNSPFFSTRNDADDMYDEWLQRVHQFFEFTCHYRSYGASCNDYERATWGAKSYPGQTNNIGKYNALKDWVDGVTPFSPPGARVASEKFPVALSTEEPLGIEGVAIYPNPAQDGKVRITPIPGVENGRISLLGVEGRVLRNLNWNGELKEVQLGQPGLYILQLDDGKGKIKQFKVINN